MIQYYSLLDKGDICFSRRSLLMHYEKQKQKQKQEMKIRMKNKQS